MLSAGDRNPGLCRRHSNEEFCGPPPSFDPFHFPRRLGRATSSLARFARSSEPPSGDLTRGPGKEGGREGGDGMGRGGGERRGREGRVLRCHRRQLCERVQCVRERKSLRCGVPGRRVPWEEGPRGGPGLGFRGCPPISFSGHSIPSCLRGSLSADPPRPFRPRRQLPVPSPTPHAPRHSPAPTRSPGTLHSLPALAAQRLGSFSWGQAGGMGDTEPRRRRERGPERPDNS